MGLQLDGTDPLSLSLSFGTCVVYTTCHAGHSGRFGLAIWLNTRALWYRGRVVLASTS